MLAGKTDKRELTISLGVAIAGLLAVILPVVTLIESFGLSVLIFWAPFVGGGAWVWFLVRRYARGWLSGAALVLLGAPAYLGFVLLTIYGAMTGV